MYYSLTTDTVLSAKTDFIERLTHDCYVVQAGAISSKIVTPLDEILSIFEQTNGMDTISITKEYNHLPQTAEMQLMVDILHHAAVDPAERKRLEDEAEAWRTFDALSGGLLTKSKKQDKKIEELENDVQRKEYEIQQQQKLIEELQKRLKEN